MKLTRIKKLMSIYRRYNKLKKLVLVENMRSDFMGYAINRKGKYNIEYNYLTEKILNNTFSFFLSHKLTVTENATSYWYKNNKKEIECCGYSGIDINFRDDLEGMKDNLFHEVFCKAEWIARSIKETWYSETVKETIGSKNYYAITA